MFFQSVQDLQLERGIQLREHWAAGKGKGLSEEMNALSSIKDLQQRNKLAKEQKNKEDMQLKAKQELKEIQCKDL